MLTYTGKHPAFQYVPIIWTGLFASKKQDIFLYSLNTHWLYIWSQSISHSARRPADRCRRRRVWTGFWAPAEQDRKHRTAHTTTGAAQPGTIVGTVYTTGSTTARRQAPTHPLFSTNARSTRQTYVIFGICDILCAYLWKHTICKKNSPLSSAACAWHSTSTPSSRSGVPALAVCCCTPPPPPLSSFY